MLQNPLLGKEGTFQIDVVVHSLAIIQQANMYVCKRSIDGVLLRSRALRQDR
jgi:hypothetical protein